jgi:hypothetical protein
MDPVSFKVEVMDRIHSVIQFYKGKNQDYLKNDVCQKHNYFLNNVFNNLNNNFTIKRAINILSFLAVNSKKLCQFNPQNHEVINLVLLYVSEINKMKKILRQNHPEYFVLPPTTNNLVTKVKVSWV